MDLKDSACKRLMDLALALLAIVLLSPLLLMVALLVWLGDHGPVFHWARRVGRGGALFSLYKFRSMVVGADKLGPGVTAQGDSRVTRVGRWLRRTKLDELPQLWNVVKGDMSLVGPRPEDPRYVELYTDEQRRVLDVRPGITSAASLAYRHEEQMLQGDDWETRYREEVMPAKLAIDLEYLRRRTVWSDLVLLLRTAAVIVR